MGRRDDRTGKVEGPEGRVARKRIEMKRDIVEAARELLLNGGPEALTLEAVAAKLDLTKQAIYYYYRSKTALQFELVIEEVTTLSQRLHDGARAAASGLDALEAVIRETLAHYRGRIDVFRLVMRGLPADGSPNAVSPEALARLRPLNDLAYGTATAKLVADIKAGRLPSHDNPRRLVFSAYVAAYGLLSMKALVEGVNDPLGYSDESLLKELCNAFRASAERGTS